MYTTTRSTQEQLRTLREAWDRKLRMLDNSVYQTIEMPVLVCGNTDETVKMRTVRRQFGRDGLLRVRN